MKNRSDHFDGRRYFNPSVPPRTYRDLMRWYLKRHVKPWPYTPIEQKKIAQARTQEGECYITFINHSSVLLQLDGWNILTDPIWSERASPFSWIGPKRKTLPGVKFEDLPEIDIVLLSHNHYDHMDLPTLKRLVKKHHPLFFVPKGNSKYLKAKGINAEMHELDWWDQFDFSHDYTIHFVPSQHFSARGIFDRDMTLWGGFVIKGAERMIYFAGDSAFCPHFAEIKKRFGSPSLALLPIGAFEPRWFMKSVHLSPDEAVDVHRILGSKQSMAIHFGTFQLSDEEIHRPVQELQRSLKKNQISDECFWVLRPGEGRIVN